MIKDAIPHPTFANHESFHLRYGWLKKAYDAAILNPRIFVSDDATIRLGVGKNMVRSMRFWALTCKVIDQKVSKPDVKPSVMGRAIFEEDGLDPYLEDPQTLWMLHWLMLAPPCRIPVWWITMNGFMATNIWVHDLTESIHKQVLNIGEWKTPATKSIKKDMDVFIHTYSAARNKLVMEDYLDCPFRQLGLISQGERDTIRFVFGRKEGMTPEIVAFACVDFAIRSKLSSSSMSVTRLATEDGGVGNAFKINERELGSLLADGCRDLKNVRMENINGTLHMILADPTSALEETLRTAYGKNKFRLPTEIEVLA